MPRSLRIALGQCNPAVGDLAGNRAIALRAVEAAAGAEADLLAMPEMCLSGYPLQDLVLRPAFQRDCMAAMRRLAEEAADSGVAVLAGGPLAQEGRVYNALYLLDSGAVRAVIRKHHLPGEGVFDEPRVYAQGGMAGPLAVRGARIGAAICEDFWHGDVAETLAESGADVLLCANGSPYETGKYDERMQVMLRRAVETRLPLAYVNLVGGQDDHVFDGGSFAVNRDGALTVQAPFFEEALAVTDWREHGDGWRCERGELASVPDRDEMDYRALTLAVRDFAQKNGFSSALLGLSGGIDSALVAAIAVDALGPGRVRAALLPSRFTSKESIDCARGCAASLGCRLDEIDIEEGVGTVAESVGGALEGGLSGVAQENVQARLRGLMLMAMANTTGALLLATGNKSEVSVGYATLYGDMCGGFAPLKDVYKTRAYRLARWRNRYHADWMRGPDGEAVPASVIERPPTAELRHGQRDDDSLPPYGELDAILEMMLERELSLDEIVEDGHARETALRVAEMVRRSEFKRFQAAPGPKITRRAFWLERRYPVTSSYRETVVAEGSQLDEDGDGTA